jgi:hypothetical protein
MIIKMELAYETAYTTRNEVINNSAVMYKLNTILSTTNFLANPRLFIQEKAVKKPKKV